MIARCEGTCGEVADLEVYAVPGTLDTLMLCGPCRLKAEVFVDGAKGQSVANEPLVTAEGTIGSD